MGLVSFVDRVQEYFTDHGVTAAVLLGRREVWRQDNQGPGGANRVVFSPGDKGGRFGQIAAAHQPGHRRTRGNARSLVNREALFVVSVWAVDNSDVTNERLQFLAADDLLEQTVRAVHWAAGGHYAWSSCDVRPDPNEIAFGVEYVASLTFRYPLLDVEVPIGTPDNEINKDLRPGGPTVGG